MLQKEKVLETNYIRNGHTKVKTKKKLQVYVRDKL